MAVRMWVISVRREAWSVERSASDRSTLHVFNLSFNVRPAMYSITIYGPCSLRPKS